MRQSQLFTKTLKTISKDEMSKNAQLLTRGGFVHKSSSGVYTFLPLGWRVIEKIAGIIREEINKIGGVEMFMPALVDRKYFEATNRFDLAVGFDIYGKKDKTPSYVLGWTHEEVLTVIASNYVSSYRDLPFYPYQIQTKFRNEKRPKSGLLRGREFLMKDLYSLHASEEDLLDYYDKVRLAFFKIFERCGLETFYTLAPGGDFTTGNTHEFQVLADVGEDTIFYCLKCYYAENKEISRLKTNDVCPECNGKVKEANAIEVGNIFPLGTKYSQALGLNFKDEEGKSRPVVMGSYGIGLSRVMATIVEKYNDDSGIIWPRSVAPFYVHLISLDRNAEAEKIYKKLIAEGVEVLYDDREDIYVGEKFTEADLLGMPARLVVSRKSLEQGGIELKWRSRNNAEIVSYEQLTDKIKIQNANSF
jgi:prolyl-tRNA synthetase